MNKIWEAVITPRPLTLQAMFMSLGGVLLFSYFVDYLCNQDYILTRELLLRGVALVNFLSLYSLSMQILGLIGSYGLIPLPTTLLKMKRLIESEKLLKKQSLSYTSISSNPSLAKDALYIYVQEKLNEFKMRGIVFMTWLSYERFNIHSDKSQMSGKQYNDAFNKHITFLMRLDLFLAVILIFYPNFVLFIYFYLINYSNKRVLGQFYNFQWDVLLMECLFLAIFVSIYSFSVYGKSFVDVFLIWAFKILFFRLMFGSGMVKMYGNDPSWNKELNAMSYHFLTQPLPNNIGRLVYIYSPKWVFTAITLSTHLSEFLIPLMTLVFPSTWKYTTAVIFWGNIGLQFGIMITGYFGNDFIFSCFI
jgi:hypothetical protein